MNEDDDGMDDNSDAFSNDPFTSVDVDGDGHPDLWNEGKTEEDSTTGLKLDHYPNDPDRWKKEEKNIPAIPIISGIIVLLILTGLALWILSKRKQREAGNNEE